MAKKGLLDRLGNTKVGGFFIDSEDSAMTEKRPEVSAPASGTGPRTAAAIPVVSVSVNNSHNYNVDPETRAKIEQIAKGADQVSYTKFSELLLAMKQALPGDEAAAFRTALGAAKTMGFPATEIIRGLDVILGQLTKAREQFQTAVPARITSKVGSRRQKIAELQQAREGTNQSINSVQTELTRLQAQAAKIEENIQNETAAISQDEQVIRSDEAKFMAAIRDVETAYSAERQKLISYGREV